MAEWDLDAVRDEVARRKRLSEAGPIDEIVLAYARWQGKTQELGLDPEAEQHQLDQLLDSVDADAWSQLKEMVGLIDDRLLAEVMRYSAKRALAQTKELVDQLEAEGPSPEPPKPKRKKTFRM